MTRSAVTRAAVVVSTAGGIHQARAASIRVVAVSQEAAVGINPAAVIKVGRVITKAGNARAATAEARTKT
jgi:ABC-type hemin transport system substrate-binding protein